MEPEPTRDATPLLRRIERGDADAVNSLLPIVYDQLRTMAHAYLRSQRPDHTLQPTALVHEAYLKLVNAPSGWKSEAHFCAVAAMAMRQILINHAEARRAVKRGRGAGKQVPLSQVATPMGDHTIDILALDEALSTLQKADPSMARIVEMWFFGGMETDQIATVLGISRRSVQRSCRAARAWLGQQLSEPSL